MKYESFKITHNFTDYPKLLAEDKARMLTEFLRGVPDFISGSVKFETYTLSKFEEAFGRPYLLGFIKRNYGSTGSKYYFAGEPYDDVDELIQKLSPIKLIIYLRVEY